MPPILPAILTKPVIAPVRSVNLVTVAPISVFKNSKKLFTPSRIPLTVSLLITFIASSWKEDFIATTLASLLYYKVR
nr:MAG TPA: hypothetical protein [Caudoviricetes sp.]